MEELSKAAGTGIREHYVRAATTEQRWQSREFTAVGDVGALDRVGGRLACT